MGADKSKNAPKDSKRGDHHNIFKPLNIENNPEIPCTGPSSKTVPCPARGSIEGMDGLDQFVFNPQRRVKTLKEMTERCWYSLDIDLEGSTGPDPRVGHALIPVPKKKEMYMIGGGSNGRSLTEIWKINYSGKEHWKIRLEPTLSLPHPGRYEFFCGLNKLENKIWLFGGISNVCNNNLRGKANAYKDVSRIDLEKGQFCEVRIPAVDLHIFGPWEREFYNCRGEQHYRLTHLNVPLARAQQNNSSTVELKGEEHLIICGGGGGSMFLNANGKRYGDGADLFMFNTSTSTWGCPKVSGDTPAPVYAHGTVALGSKVYTFGGSTFRELYDDFFVIDLEPAEVKWSKLCDNVLKPSPRASHGMATNGKDIYVFGGLGQHGCLSDLWKYDTESKVWCLLDSGMLPIQEEQKRYQVQPRFNMAMTCLTVDLPAKNGGGFEKCDIIVINGGMNMTGHMFDDTWIFPLFNLD